VAVAGPRKSPRRPLTDFFRLPGYDLSMSTEAHSDFRKQLQDYRLTTAEIIYHLPDHPSLLQSYIWQELDIAPRFPILNKFLRFWETKLEGKLFLVKVAHQALITPSEWRYAGGEFTLQ
jgi:uncharacterized protein Usg